MAGLIVLVVVVMVIVELKVVISTPSTSIAPSVAIIFGFLFWVRAANAVRLSCPFGGGGARWIASRLSHGAT